MIIRLQASDPCTLNKHQNCAGVWDAAGIMEDVELADIVCVCTCDCHKES